MNRPFRAHLSDDEIQSWLDNKSSEQRIEIETHVKNCRSCRRELSLYQQLYGQLDDPTSFLLPANFAASVVARINGKQSRAEDYIEWGLLGVAFLAGLVSLVYYTELGQSLNTLTAMGIELFTSLKRFVPFASEENAVIFGGLALILAAVGIVDRFLPQFRTR